MTMSESGQYLVTGETATLGVRAVVRCWDTRDWSIVGTHQTHHAKVQSLSISEDDSKLVSLGGQDDNTVVVWSIQSASALCSHTVGTGKSGSGLVVSFLTSNKFVVGGKDLLQTWSIESRSGDNKLTSYNVSLGKLKRDLTVIEKDDVRDCLYFGTASGDIIKIALNSKSGGNPAMIAACVRKVKKGQSSNVGRFSGGVTSILLLANGELLIGCGNGDIVCVEQTNIKKTGAGGGGNMVSDPTHQCLVERRLTSVGGRVTSMLLGHSNREVILATAKSEIIKVTLLTFDKMLLMNSPSSNIK